ncbi:hypothetical protein COCON_G00034380 [Conger conger]|uniref:C3H1-type domain-containing protein n=1 Tax=Conger conger TaxID=82655 RepID=A0A9Q1DZE0_CONCO|nr:hypothetical protein COCON_G00034380 [Conger conger]
MAFASLFSGPPNEGLHVADCVSSVREKAGEDKAAINYDGTQATKKKRKKRKKKKWDTNGKVNMSTMNGQQEEPEDRCRLWHIPDQEHRPGVQRKNEWLWDYNIEVKNSQSGNPLKRKRKGDDHGGPKNKRDFASELDQYRRIREAPPPADPPSPLPQQTGGLSQTKEKMNIRGQENPGKTWIHKRNRAMPGPGGRGRGGRGRGRGRGGMSQGSGLQNNKPDGRNYGNGRGQKGGQHKGQHKPKEEKKKVFLTEEYINRHTVEAQGRRICKYFLRGDCRREDQCNFEHDMNVKKMEDFPCRFFHTGAKCYQGDTCRFSHEPLTDLTRELLHRSLNPEPVMKEVPEPIEQDFSSSPLPPVAKLTVDMSHNAVSVRPNFYNSSPLTECQLQGGSTLPPSSGLNIQGEKRTVPVGAPALEKCSPMRAHSPAVPDSTMKWNPVKVNDGLISSPVEGASSVLQTLFMNLCPTHEEPQNSGTVTGVSASPHVSDEGALIAKKRKAQDTAPTKPETNVCDWLVNVEARSSQHEAETCEEVSAPFYKPLSSQDGGELDVQEEMRLRNEPALVPLQPIPGIARRDPRSGPLPATITLALAPFARTVEWDTEEPFPLRPQVVTSPQSFSPTHHSQRLLVGTPEHSSCSSTPPENLPQAASSAVHKLPVPALAGLIHPTYSRGGVKPEGGAPAARETQSKGHVLKGLFKSFLPACDL